MEITKELYAAHQGLSACSVRFLESVKNNPAFLKRSNFNHLVKDHRFDDYVYQPWPTFINQRTKKEMKEAAVNVFNLVTTIPGRLFDDDVGKISRYYGLSEADVMLICRGIDDKYTRSLLGRGDFIFSPYGGLKCLEFNVQSTLGGWQLDPQETLYVNVPVISRFLKEHNVRLCPNTFFSTLLDHMGEHAREWLGDSGKEMNTAIVLPHYIENKNPGTDDRLKRIRHHFCLNMEKSGVKGEVIFCNFDNLRVVDECLMYKDKKIHIMIERCNGLVPSWVMEVVGNRNSIIYNGPITFLLTNKLNLALLSQHQDSHMFSPEEKEIIREYIPWTRKIIPGETTYRREKVNLENFILSNRKRLVMKPGGGIGGYDVFLGFNTPPVRWEQQLERVLLEKNWVVQEYVPSFPYLYQVGDEGCAVHHAVWGLFVFGCRYAGGFVRILPEKGNKGVINTQQGAEKSIILEVEE